jgi:hypothetical protein
MKHVRFYRTDRRGLGDVVQAGIHHVIDAAPLPAATKTRIKSCGGCGRRAQALNKLGRTVRRAFTTVLRHVR